MIGLHRIHQVTVPGERSEEYQLVHQDIKPDNILVDLDPAGRGPYQFGPIIADLGHSHTRHISADISDVPAVDRRGNQTYCAPESSHHADFRRTGPNRITSEADIFSAGAVFSDAASWVAKGDYGRQDYLNRRRDNLGGKEGFGGSGYETAFHDGDDRLSCVDEMHHDIRSCVPSQDNLTPRVLDIIEKHMMVLPNSRLRASLLRTKFELEVRRAKTELSAIHQRGKQSQQAKVIRLPDLHVTFPELDTPPASGKVNDGIWSPHSTAVSESSDGCFECHGASSPSESPHSTTHPAFIDGLKDLSLTHPSSKRPNELLHHRPYTTPIPPSGYLDPQAPRNRLRSVSETKCRLSMADATAYYDAMKANKRSVDPKVESTVEILGKNLRKRDYLFFIDDTDSMKEYAPQIQKAFRTLAYIAKPMDPDYLELSFVSDPLSVCKSRHTSSLVDKVQQCKYTAFKGQIESSLGTVILEKIIKHLPYPLPVVGNILRRGKPITIFVFTDGKWGDGIPLGNGLDTSIRNLMEEVKSRRLNRTHVMFQFLRFGEDEKGLKHLEFLDRFGKEEKW